MIKMDHLKNNGVWIAVKISGSFMLINDTPYYVFVLMDAVNATVFGHVVVEAFGGLPDSGEVEALFRKAYKQTNKWPEKLIVADKSVVSELFKKEAEKNGVEIDTVPMKELSPIIAPFVEEFANRYK